MRKETKCTLRTFFLMYINFFTTRTEAPSSSPRRPTLDAIRTCGGPLSPVENKIHGRLDSKLRPTSNLCNLNPKSA